MVVACGKISFTTAFPLLSCVIFLSVSVLPCDSFIGYGASPVVIGTGTTTSAGTRWNRLLARARKSKDELESIVIAAGLQPASTRRKKTPKALRPNEIRNIKIPLEVQLEYARNGSGVLRGFLDPELIRQLHTDLADHAQSQELEAWRQKVEVGSNNPKLARKCQTIEDCKRELRRLKIGLDKLPFLQFFNNWRIIKSVRDLCFHLGETASLLMDVTSVRLYQDSLFIKRCSDGPTPWHTDARMAPFDSSNMITFWIPLQAVTENGSGLVFVPKSHCDFALPFWNEFEGEEFHRLDERYSHKVVHYMPLDVGDLTIHNGWTLHAADPNISKDHARLALAISYVDAKAEIRENALNFDPSSSGYGDNEDQWSYREWVKSVPARQEFGDHPLVPIVFP